MLEGDFLDLQILLSTMNQNNYNILNKMNINSDIIVINQNNKDNTENFIYNNHRVLWINSINRGLSISRNEAIKNASNDICLIADDDLEYINNYRDIVIDKFKSNPHCDVITFQVEGIEKPFKKYNVEERELNYLTTMKVSSVEIAFKLSSINNKNIRFNELFGAGSKYYLGEENIFLYECLKNNLKVLYCPVKIANLHIKSSSWFKGFTKDYFICRGASFAALSKLFSILFILQFSIRKHNLYKSNLSLLKSIKYMFEGRKSYLKDSNIF